MQQHLPPGYSLAGVSVPALGGVLQRVRRDSDGHELLARSAGDEYAGDAVARHLDAELGSAALRGGSLRPTERIDGSRQSWLLYDGVAGQPLDTSEPRELQEFWDIAEALTNSLADAHRSGRAHGRLESNCIWWDPASRRVGLVGILPVEHAHLANRLPATVDTAPELLVSDHAPVSPTADVYSLGAIFYRLLSGRPVLSSTGNLAFDAAANAPARLDPERAPQRLAELVERMLSKAPASRPPDASAVLDEIEAIRVGAKSVPPSLDFRPSALIGRSRELELLFEHACVDEDGPPALVRVAGEPGVGKSHLLAEFSRRMARDSYLVGHAKFEQFHRGRPYGTLLTACGNALSHALASNELSFARTKRRLQEANPILLGVLAPDIPELVHLCGDLPIAAETGPTESRARFKRAFRELLGKLGTPEAPLALVLDDLQWADEATADLLQELFEVGLPDHCSLVLAYRETAASQNLELGDLLTALADTPLVSLGPFGTADIEMLCRAVVPDCEALETLVAVVHQRSQGNALHSLELLRNFALSGELTRSGGRFRFEENRKSLSELSETVAELIRSRLSLEQPLVRRVLAAAACIGHGFSEELVSTATGHDASSLKELLQTAVRSGFLALAPSGEYVFCHDRIQQVALEASDDDSRREVYLRLGRSYRQQVAQDRSVLFSCLDYLNEVRDALDDDERRDLELLNLAGAKQARASIAYQRAIPLVRLYLESDRISAADRFEATLLLAECLSLLERPGDRRAGDAATGADQAFAECAALATTDAQKLTLSTSRLSSCVHRQAYLEAVEVGSSALRVLGHPLPARPSMARAIGAVVWLSGRMRRADPDALAAVPDRATESELEAFKFLVGLWGPSFWLETPALNILVSIRLMEMTLRCGNGRHSSMAYACYAAICHFLGKYETAIRYGRVANRLAIDHSPYTRAAVRFLTLTFFGVFEYAPREIVQRYDQAVKEGVSHGELVASHLIDGAVTTLPHLGPELPRVLEALQRYDHEARAMGATTSLEMIHLARCWCDLLVKGAVDPLTGERRLNALHEPVTHESFAAGRDLLRMQIEYLWGNDDEVLRLARAVRANPLLKGNPLHKASYAVFVVLASTRSRRGRSSEAREALKFLERLDGVRPEGESGPGTLRPSLLLARGALAAARGEAGAAELLKEAAAGAAERGQGLMRAIGLERLAHVHAARGEYGLFVEYLRDSAHGFTRFGATAKVEALIREFPGIDWTHLGPRSNDEAGIQGESVMRAASAIVEATSTDELGPTLLRVIATAAGAMRALLFTFSEGNPVLTATCERDRENVPLSPTPMDELDPRTLALKPVRRVERARQIVELPRDIMKFPDDPYLAGSKGPRSLLVVPLMYRGDLVAILYLENSSNAETFSQDEITLVTLLGKQAAIALTNADNHRLEIEALQSKVNPHFLYNALTSIAHLVGKKPDDAEEAVYELSRLYRYMVSSRAEQRVPLDKELGLVRDYLELEKARFEDRLRVKWDVAEAAAAFPVPALLVQPLAENAVKHGVSRNVHGGTVTISARIENDALLLVVSDDGPGWSDGRGGTGFGLKSVRRRLQLLYGTRAEMRIVKGAGVAVHLRIPASRSTSPS